MEISVCNAEREPTRIHRSTEQTCALDAQVQH